MLECVRVGPPRFRRNHPVVQRRWLDRAATISLTVLLATTGCQGLRLPAGLDQTDAPSGGAGAPGDDERTFYPGSMLKADQTSGVVGSQLTLSGSGFPAHAAVSLTWQTFDGRYQLEQDEVVYVGPRYAERTTELPGVQTDGQGAFQAALTVPEDFGGNHDVVARVDGQFATKFGYAIKPAFSVTTWSGPVGTPIEISATGLGMRNQESMWEVSWDNGFTGYMMGVMTHGTATARIRASGQPGPHVLKIWRNYRGIPYLNPHQGPFGALPEPTTFVFNVTPGTDEAPTIWAEPQPETTVRATPEPQGTGGARLTVTPDRGTVGAPVTLRGEGFQPNQSVQLTWASRAGQKITATGLLEGFEERLRELPAVTAGPDGAFTLAFSALDDYAGAHRITATAGTATAESYYSTYASILEFTASARVGEDVKVHMKGVGWTIQGKTYGIVYDNVYLGYGCSFSSRGDVDLHLPASGTPGRHTIDLYPEVYEGQDPTPNIYSRPNLTFLNDHPGGALPAFHLTLTVTE